MAANPRRWIAVGPIGQASCAGCEALSVGPVAAGHQYTVRVVPWNLRSGAGRPAVSGPVAVVSSGLRRR